MHGFLKMGEFFRWIEVNFLTVVISIYANPSFVFSLPFGKQFI